MGIIKAKQLVHEYIRRDEEGNVESVSYTHLPLERNAVDTLKLARKFLPKEQKKDLESLCACFGDVYKRQS